MMYAYDESYIEGAMIRLGDMIEYACLDMNYDSDNFFKMFIMSGIARRFEIGDVSVVAGRSGPELAQMVLTDVDHVKDFKEPVWREYRSDLYWCGWALAYFQWHEKMTFKEIWQSISIRMMQKMYELNKKIYGDSRRAPTLNIHGDRYSFSTYGDTGTGTAFANLITFDLALAIVMEM